IENLIAELELVEEESTNYIDEYRLFKQEITPQETHIKEKDNKEIYFQLTKSGHITNMNELKILTKVIQDNKSKNIGIDYDTITEHERARKVTEKTKLKDKRIQDSRIVRNQTIINPVDKVMVHTDHKANKLDTEWLGPATQYVISISSSYNLDINELLRQPSIIKASIEKLDESCKGCTNQSVLIKQVLDDERLQIVNTMNSNLQDLINTVHKDEILTVPLLEDREWKIIKIIYNLNYLKLSKLIYPIPTQRDKILMAPVIEKPIVFGSDNLPVDKNCMNKCCKKRNITYPSNSKTSMKDCELELMDHSISPKNCNYVILKL
ncbi:unnamed protein product, partial [Heterotrigona itama]